MQTYEPHKWSPPKRCHAGRFLLRPVYDARADPAWYADKGGVYQDSVMRYTSTIVPYLIAMPLLDSDNPASPCRTSGKGQDGSAPPFLPLYRHAWRGGTTAFPPFWGRSRPIYLCGKAPNTYDKRALPRRRQAPWNGAIRS